MPEFISVLRWIRDTAYPYIVSAVSSVSSDKAAIDAVAGTLSSITALSNQAIIAADEAETSATSAANSLSQINTQVIQASNSALQSAASAQEAQDLVDDINGISAQAQTLVAGSLATASYNPADGKLTFGIPQGSKGDRGDNFTPNAQGTLANRVNYDGQNNGFSYLATDTGDLYFKLSNTSGDWSAAYPFGKGDTGAQGVQGVGISSVAKTSGTGAAGTIDVYTITLSDTTTYNFNVYNGANGQVESVAGRTGTVVLTKADVNLNNVDNTSDANKPISIAAQNEFNTITSSLNNIVETPIPISYVTKGTYSIVGTDGYLTDGVISYSEGYDYANINSRETYTGDLIPSNGYGTDGTKYLKKIKGVSAPVRVDVAPVYGGVSDIGDYYADGIWYDLTGTPYITPQTYLNDSSGKLVGFDVVGSEVVDIVITDIDVPKIIEKVIQADKFAYGRITGTATFTSTTNNISLAGIGKLSGLEIGDVIRISGATDTKNNSEFTVEVITDDDNIIVNQAHANKGTLKNVATRASDTGVTVKLLVKYYNAPPSLGRDYVSMSASRLHNTSYTNNTKREMIVCAELGQANTQGCVALVDSKRVAYNINVQTSIASEVNFTVPSGSSYLVNNNSIGGTTVTNWYELR